MSGNLDLSKLMSKLQREREREREREEERKEREEYFSIIPSCTPSHRMPHCYVVNERGLVRVQPSNAGSVIDFLIID